MPSTDGPNRLVELEAAVEQLDPADYSLFRNWFLEYDWTVWDRQIAADAAAGRLDFLAREARDEKASGRLRDL